MLSSSQDLVAVLNYGVEVSDAGAELGLHVTQEQGGGGGPDLTNVPQHRHYHCRNLKYNLHFRQ